MQTFIRHWLRERFLMVHFSIEWIVCAFDWHLLSEDLQHLPHQSISPHVPNYYLHPIRIQGFPKGLVLRYGWYPVAITGKKNKKVKVRKLIFDSILYQHLCITFFARKRISLCVIQVPISSLAFTFTAFSASISAARFVSNLACQVLLKTLL